MKLDKEKVKTWVRRNGLKVAEATFATIGVGWTVYTAYNAIMYSSVDNVDCGIGANPDTNEFSFSWTKRDRFGKLHPSTGERITWIGDSGTDTKIADLIIQAGRIARGEQEDFED